MSRKKRNRGSSEDSDPKEESRASEQESSEPSGQGEAVASQSNMNPSQAGDPSQAGTTIATAVASENAPVVETVSGDDGEPAGDSKEEPVSPLRGGDIELEPILGSPAKPFPIVGIGASAGGLDAFTTLLRALPSDSGMAFVLVQHMDPKHESILNKLLAKETAMPVAQVTDGMDVEPNHVYVIPPNREMTIRDGFLRLLDRPKGMAGHTPIDSFFTALAQDQKGLSIGVILSGIGSDGTAGCRAIKAAGGLTFAQDELSAKFSGMPSSAALSGCVDFQLPAARIAEELAGAAKHPFVTGTESLPRALAEDFGDGNFNQVLRKLQITSGVNFSYYKPSTLRRRIARRMVLAKTQNLGEYVRYLDGHPREAEQLFEDILIHVTGFFREPEVFEALAETVFAQMRERVLAGESVRIWVAGCSTGEEVYSIAIRLLEQMRELAPQARIQIFGTDVSNQNIDIARSGIYPETTVATIEPERVRRFFIKTENGYQVSKQLRDMCIFARHDLGKDPPFSKLDLISCRNVLIYLGSALQKRAIAIFHYALKPEGYLVLGGSESISLPNLFDVEDSQNKIYKRHDSPSQPFPEMLAPDLQRKPVGHPQEAPREYDPRKEAERIVLERYAPAGVVLNEGLEVLNFQGDIGPYMRPSSGPPSFDLMKLLPTELVIEIRKLVSEVKKFGGAVRREALAVDLKGDTRRVDLEAIPIRRNKDAVDFLILFVERKLEKEQTADTAPVPVRAEPSVLEEDNTRLRAELDSTRQYLRSVIEDSEASSEELRAANEEVLSSNEELHSTNEELETAKEELQSANEELTTLNEEMHNRNQELTQLANDLSSLLAGIEIPVVILGADRRIRRYTPAAEPVFNLIPSDVGRPISNIKANLDIPDLEKMLDEALERNSGMIEREVQDSRGRWFSLRLRPYKMHDGKAEAVMLALLDVDAVKRSADAIVETVRTPLMVLDSGLRVVDINPAFAEGFGVKKSEVEGQSLFEISKGEWDLPGLRRLLLEILPGKSIVVDFELDTEFRNLGRRKLLINARQMMLRGMEKALILLAIEDETEKLEAQTLLSRREAALRATNKKLSNLTGEVMVRSERTSRKIARDLHDAFAHGLLAVSLKLSNLEKDIPRPVMAKKVHSIAAEARKLATAIQEFARGLHPAVLEELGLTASLKTEAAGVTKRYGISVAFAEKNVPKNLPDEIASCLYRVAQEALRNIGQHSRAKGARILLEGTPKEIKMTISDSGDGFDVELGRRMGGLGLISMEERIRLVGGSLDIISHRGDGVTIEVRVPRKPKRRNGLKRAGGDVNETPQRPARHKKRRFAALD